ncbi:preprotein translocase subunit SecA [Candidatus Wolfebacteria bacterium]|nr:preprotein translocase subunit SecA [Candidatus Wolfebacteria bacterium]
MFEGLTKLFVGEPGAAEIKRLRPIVAEINALEEECKEKTDDELKASTKVLQDELSNGKDFNDVIVRAFANTREVAYRATGLRPYDVQLIGGLILAHGKVAEMRTGEGKTLVATLPAYVHALKGKGVHVVTVNDYLAKRDAAWMGQVYSGLGMTLGVVTGAGAFIYDPGHSDIDKERDEKGFFKIYEEFLRPVTKKEAYAADITYGTNNEFGFDYLRDNTAFTLEQKMQRGHHYALVDEVDSILIDEARTPLIISAPVEDTQNLYEVFSQIVGTFTEEDYIVDEKQKAVSIQGSGIDKAEKILNVDNLYAAGGVKYAHHLENAVRAKALFRKDKEYVVRDGEIVIVDEFTGRLQPGRRWSEGLHQAVEAREKVKIQKESRTMASITFQNYFRMYENLAGMTGTAYSSREELYTVYELEVVPVPTHKEIGRSDHEDFIFQTEAGKYKALATKVMELHKKGQPVLIGTVSIDDNEVVGNVLTKAGIPHEILNAKNHEREGEIIANAGKKGNVTVATNMAGRGVDIKLGGETATLEQQKEVKDLGGLFVLGTERHEARRTDDQLRGRSGRQGDPGETQFLVSLEDKLMRIFATDSIKKMMGRFGIPEDEPIANKMITGALESAQQKIEGVNFDARKQVLAYDDVLNHQRKIFYDKRNVVLAGSVEDIEKYIKDIIAGSGAEEALTAKEKEFGKEKLYKGMRGLLLQLFDALWIDHLETMEYLRRSVSLRAYGQRDPLVEYRREGLNYFKEMEATINEKVITLIPNIQEKEPEPKPIILKTSGGSETASTGALAKSPEYGRNDIVIVSNGEEEKEMKFKKAEALLAKGWKIVKK